MQIQMGATVVGRLKARLAGRPRQRRVRLGGVWLADVERRENLVRLVLERRGVRPGALARPWLIDAAGTAYPAVAMLRQVTPGRVREIYTLLAPPQALDLLLHLSAGAGCDGIDLPLPAPAPAAQRSAA